LRQQQKKCLAGAAPHADERPCNEEHVECLSIFA
jgi:hypothetical protein